MKMLDYTRRSFGVMNWLGVVSAIAISANDRASAQIVPDASLGSESSVVTPNTVIRGLPSDRIDGGAIRGSNLFHSFQQFNIGEGRGAYFANPAGIENILSRVTGNSRSDILGRLGVLGNANLFLLNPNGILFGPNASLDVAGSFTATTANAIALGDQGFFSATQPDKSSLLAIAPGALFFDQQLRQPRTIQNSGTLTAGRDLTLAADNLELQGQVRSGGNLTLQAKDTLRIRDSMTDPFIASAGGSLLVQGDQSVDIFALNHPDSGLFSGGDMVLRSGGSAQTNSSSSISGDAHYFAGGSFLVEQLNGLPGNLTSKTDPVIRSLGDVSFNFYSGTSLHILAAGKVEIPGGIHITGADALNGLVETVTLSDGTSISINGRIEPTLDVRAGVNPSAIAGSSITGMGIFVPNPTLTTVPTSADIILGNIFFADTTNQFIAGKLLVTNQYQSNSALTGNIQLSTISSGSLAGGGSIAVDSRGDLNVSGIVTAGPFPGTTGILSGNGGNIIFLANNNIAVKPNPSISPTGLINSAGLVGGNITFKSGGAITLTDSFVTNANYGSATGLKGGSLKLSAQSLSMTNSGLNTSTLGRVDAGDITLNILNDITMAGSGGTISGIQSNVERGANANGGSINITAGSLSLNGVQVQTLVRGQDSSNNLPAGRGKAGDITIDVRGTITAGGINEPYNTTIDSSVGVGTIGQGGNINLAAESFSLKDGAQIRSDTYGQGNAGNITLKIDGSVSFDGVVTLNGRFTNSGAFSNVQTSGVGNGGSITITAGALSLTDGGTLSSSAAGQGDAGNVTVNVDRDITIAGFDLNSGFQSEIGTVVAPTASGKGGSITLTGSSLFLENDALLSTATYRQAGTNGRSDAGNIQVNVTDAIIVTNGAQFRSDTYGQGNAGNITLQANGSVLLDGVVAVNNQFASSGAFSTVNQGAIGKGGNVEVSAGSLAVTNGATVNASTFGQGDGGNVKLTVRDAAVFDGVTPDNRFSSGASSTVNQGAIGQGGSVEVSAGSLAVTNGATLTASTSGQGDGGNVKLTVRDAAVFDGVTPDNRFSSGASSTVNQGAIGQGGSVEVSAGSLAVTNGATLTASTSGQGDGGNVKLTVRDAAVFDGVTPDNRFSSGASSTVNQGAIGQGGSVEVSAGSLAVTNGATLTASTFGQGDAGNVRLTIRGTAAFDGVTPDGRFGSGASSTVNQGAIGQGGNVEVSAGSLFVTNGAALSASTFGQGNGGNISLNVEKTLQLSNGAISTLSLQTSGGAINIIARDIRLFGNSNITTFVFSGAGNGGDITLSARSIVALGDSNILTFARSGKGGNINLSTRAFFGQNYQPAPSGIDPSYLIGNGRVDVNASGTVSGIITIPDTTFIQNSLTQLAQNLIDPNTLLANSCIVRNRERGQNGSFLITGSGGLPVRPGDAPPASFPTGEVRSLPEAQTNQVWQPGDPIVEPQGIYRLANGKLVMSRECEP